MDKAKSLYPLLANDAEQYLFTHYQMNQLYISELVIEQGPEIVTPIGLVRIIRTSRIGRIQTMQVARIDAKCSVMDRAV